MTQIRTAHTCWCINASVSTRHSSSSPLTRGSSFRASMVVLSQMLLRRPPQGERKMRRFSTACCATSPAPVSAEACFDHRHWTVRCIGILNVVPIPPAIACCCIVPAGDGTLRKNPSIWTKWNTAMGSTLHPLQVIIAKRGLQLLKPGGLLVYSTCSMSPFGTCFCSFHYSSQMLSVPALSAYAVALTSYRTSIRARAVA